MRESVPPRTAREENTRKLLIHVMQKVEDIDYIEETELEDTESYLKKIELLNIATLIASMLDKVDLKPRYEQKALNRHKEALKCIADLTNSIEHPNKLTDCEKSMIKALIRVCRPDFAELNLNEGSHATELRTALEKMFTTCSSKLGPKKKMKEPTGAAASKFHDTPLVRVIKDKEKRG